MISHLVHRAQFGLQQGLRFAVPHQSACAARGINMGVTAAADFALRALKTSAKYALKTSANFRSSAANFRSSAANFRSSAANFGSSAIKSFRVNNALRIQSPTPFSIPKDGFICPEPKLKQD